MQAVRPIARRCVAPAVPTRSRIPHIEYHISRRTQRPQLKPEQCRSITKATCVRHKTTVAAVQSDQTLWPLRSADKSVHVLDQHPSLQEHSAATATNDLAFGPSSNGVSASLPTEEAIADVQKLIDDQNPERLFAWLAFTPQGHDFTITAEDVEFESVFCAIDPKIVVEPFKSALRFSLTSDNRDILERLRDFLAHMSGVYELRRQIHQLSLAPCRHLLGCAAVAGDLRSALSIWNYIKQADYLDPDLACYNHMLEAFAWNLGWSRAAMGDWRNTDRNIQFRSKIPRPKSLLGYTLDERSEVAIRPRVLEIFRAVSAKSMVTDESTFANLLIAFGRCKDLDSVASILKSVWNIDVDALDNFDEEEVESPTFYDENHPLRPSRKLLFAVVHTFCTNHQVSRAEKLLDYISRNYALTIPVHVWEELFMWTYVYSINRSAAKEKQGQGQGRLPPNQPELLFARITDAPYNVRPTPIMINLLTRNLRQRALFDKCLLMLRQTQAYLHEDLDHLAQIRARLVNFIESQQGLFDNALLSEQFLALRHAYQMAFINARQQLDLLRVELRRMISRQEGFYGLPLVWSSQLLPQLVAEFMIYLPNSFRYPIRNSQRQISGRVTMKLGGHRYGRQDAQNLDSFVRECSKLFSDLDTHDLAGLAHNISGLVPNMQQAGLKDTVSQERAQSTQFKPQNV